MADSVSADPRMNLCAEGADQRISGILLVPLGVGLNVASESFQRWRRCVVGCSNQPLAFSPSSTRRRIAFESVGLSVCLSAHLTIVARVAGSGRGMAGVD